MVVDPSAPEKGVFAAAFEIPTECSCSVVSAIMDLKQAYRYYDVFLWYSCTIELRWYHFTVYMYSLLTNSTYCLDNYQCSIVKIVQFRANTWN